MFTFIYIYIYIYIYTPVYKNVAILRYIRYIYAFCFLIKKVRQEACIFHAERTMKKNRKARHYHVVNKSTASCAYGIHFKQSYKLLEGNGTVLNGFNRELVKLSRSSSHFEAQWLLLQTGKCIN